MEVSIFRALMPPSELADVSLGDLLTFLAVTRHRSLSGAARELDVTPSQVSKAISRLERQLKMTLLSRGARGITVSDAGQRAIPLMEEVVAKLRELRDEPQAASPELTLAAPSYLSFAFLPRIVRALPNVRVRGLELPPSLLRAYAGENFYHVTLTAGPLRLPGSWMSTHVGEVRRALYASPELAAELGEGPVKVERLANVPFISPVFLSNGQFIPIDDGCPLGLGQRRLGHEIGTIGQALELATFTNQLVFGPALAARHYLDHGLLVEVPVEGWASSDPLHVACNMDRVLSRVQSAIVEVVRNSLDALQAAEPQLESPKRRVALSRAK